MVMTGTPDVPFATTDRDGAVVLSIKAVPGAKRPGIQGVHGEALKVAVAQPPENGAANEAICRLIARALGIPHRQVTVSQGHARPWKTLRVEGTTPEAVAGLV